MSALLAFSDLEVSLGGREVVRGVTAAFDGPGLVAVIGPNGAGKTTLLKALVGLVPYRGAISVMGGAVEKLDARERALRLAYLPQGHVYHWPLPARDIVALGRYARGARDPARLPAADAQAVDAALAATGAMQFADRPVTELSGGERARVALARVLAAETPIALADEPIASLDPFYQLSIMTLLKSAAAGGKLIIVVLHDLALAWRFADRIVMMRDGAIVADGPPRAALTDERLRAAFGVDAVFIEHAGATLLARLDVAT
ncbi:MAG: ABC transporter [Rhizobiales bacterium 65-9]|nr:ABC transporter ATP-binding protein [Hyphomicrobiales bacterium]OJY37931.1 MAG: ABC transporter [Rhizobiales bacterium 65-9]